MKTLVNFSSGKTLLGGFILSLLMLAVACGGNSSNSTPSEMNVQPEETEEISEHGVGPATDMDDLGTGPIKPEFVDKGKAIYEVKCSSCHSLGDNRIVGPGWKDVTKRRTGQWIVNMVTNTEEMLDNDPEAQKQIEECMVRMPNQNLDINDAKVILEFMRQNDSAQ